MSPWHSWLREKGALLDIDELPREVPLVSHPLWNELAQILQFKPGHRKRARREKHINLLEVEAVLLLEKCIGSRAPCSRPLIGSDSQVALAALLKGRAASPSINRLLSQSLAVHLGAELYPSFGFVASLANVADDPTRHARIPPCKPLPSWWESAERCH